MGPYLARLGHVVCAAPDLFHEEQTVAALEAGKHVLCERPMAPTLAACVRMSRASKRTGRKLMIGQVCRYSPGFTATQRLISEGRIGELFLVQSEYAHDYSFHPGVDNWRKDPGQPRQPVLGGGCHAVDLLRWIAGNPSQASSLANHKVLIDWPVDDCAVGLLQFPSGVIGSVMVSVGCKRDYTMRSAFYGTRGTIIADNTSPHLMLFKDRLGGAAELFPELHDQTAGIRYPVGVNHHNFAGEIAELAACVRDDTPVRTDGREGASTVAVCLALVESASRGGAPVPLAYDF